MNRQNSASYVGGLFLVVLGGLWLLNNLNLIDFSPWRLWPMIPLAIGLGFHAMFFLRGRDAGVLVPGGILTTYGLFFLLQQVTEAWWLSGTLWGIYPLGVAIGLFELYLFGGRQAGLLWPVGILGIVGISGIASMTISWGAIGALILIGVGAKMVIERTR